MTPLNTRQAKIAVVGVAAQIPSGNFSSEDLNYETFWEFLVNKGQAYEPLGQHLFSSSPFSAVQPQTNLPSKGAFLKNYDGLDAIAFGISAKDARVMPFTARRLLELSFAALEDSGIDYRGRNIGCFMSGTSNFEVEGSLSTDGSFASVPSALANRISYMLNITGPSIQVDTACSSSLSALHLAILSMESGDCSAALVGAAQINRVLGEWNNYVMGGVLSRDGITKPFDDDADGFGRGEGAVAVVLKPLEDAMRDNDHIYAVILGSAINATGSQMPLNVPSAVAQMECIQKAYARAGKNTADADYAELHVTGTSVGDRIEANAAGKAFARGAELLAGSVKGNIGHLEAAAFLASLLKACHILEKKIIPPTVNLRVPSTAIDWETSLLRVPTEPTPLQTRSKSGHSLISISGAGIGGSTGHVVIESPPSREHLMDGIQGLDNVTFILGGLSPRAVADIAESVRDADFSDLQTMSACAVTLGRRARQMPWRTWFTRSVASTASIPAAILVPQVPPLLAFVFSGQGPQHLQMGRGLFAISPVFRRTILDLDDVYRRVMGVSLIESTGLFAAPTAASPQPLLSLEGTAWPVTVTVAAIAMLQIALFDLLSSVGITPRSLVGHSAGETAILYASGAGSKEMALEIAIARGQAMTPTESSKVGMASLACSAEVAARIISGITIGATSPLELSCFNSPDSVAVSGPTALLDTAIQVARDEGIFAQRIRTMVPGHSSFMDTIKDDYLSRMSDIFHRYPGRHVPRVPVFSTCTGRTLVEEFTPTYFWKNCRNPVLFSPAIANLMNHHASLGSNPITFLEISCHPVLASSVSRHGVLDKSILCPMRRPLRSQRDHLCCGDNRPDNTPWASFAKHPFSIRPIPAPKTHFSQPRPHSGATGPLTRSNNLLINEDTHPPLAQHVINGQPIMPATGFVEILLEAGARTLWDVHFLSVFPLSRVADLRLAIERIDCRWSLKSDNVSDPMYQEYAHGLMDISPPARSSSTLDLESLWARLPAIKTAGFYESIKGFAAFGPVYQRVVRCHGGPSEVIAEVRGHTTDDNLEYRLNPIILDACLHIMLHPDISKEYNEDSPYLPSELGRFVYYGTTTPRNWFSHIRRRKWSPDARSYDIIVTDDSGAIICEFTDLQVRKPAVLAPRVERRFDLVFQPTTITVPICTNRTVYHEHKSHADTETLFRILDSLALKMISISLQKHLSVGTDPSRQRYFLFAKSAVQNSTVKPFSTEDNKTMRTKYPVHFDITERIASIHDTVFDSPERAVDVLYSDDVMTRFYGRASQKSGVYAEVTKAFSSVLDSLFQGGKRTINILEVGAGTGLLTNYLIEEIERKPELLVNYTVTDASYALASELARNDSHYRIIPKVYDITKDPANQGFLSDNYDVIVALHVLHVAPDIRSCLSSLQTLLIPGGFLVIVEIDGRGWGEKTGSVWFDCMFGCFPEWFSYSDTRTHCTMAPTAWMAELEHLGFVNTHASVEEGDGGHNFLFTAQKPNPICSDDDLESKPLRILPYSMGSEMELRDFLRNLSPEEHHQVYLVVLAGRDGDAAIGLRGTLGREFPFWDIRLALFESTTDLLSPEPIISACLTLFNRGECVVYFPHQGGPRVSRVVPSVSPPCSGPENHPIELINQDHLLVEIVELALTAPPIRGFVGRIVTSHVDHLLPGDLVAGITDRSDEPLLLVHIGNVVALQPDLGVRSADLLNLVVPALIVKHIPIRSHPPTRIIIALLDEDLGGAIHEYLQDTTTAEVVRCDFKDQHLLHCVHVVVTDSGTYKEYPRIRQWVPRTGRFLLWDTIIRDTIADDHWAIHDALSARLQSVMACKDRSSRSHSIYPVGPGHRSLFSPDKTYLLMGGIGGLGIDLAVWMYQHGARQVVLTSRRGMDSLDLRRDAEALTKVAYLRERRDLILRLVKCDATDSAATSRLIKSLHSPLAGCFQMALVLSDALFLNQSETNFTTVRDSKVKAFDVFASHVDVASLDFYVAFSSLSGLVGFPGQSNYSSACAVLNGILARYPNAFSIIVPGIRGVGYLDRTDSNDIDKSDSGTFAISMSASQLWMCVHDGLQMLRGGVTFNQYIPDFNWNALHKHYPLPVSFHHLLRADDRPLVSATAEPLAAEEVILDIVLSVVEVELDDFDFNRPLLAYGLDSLSSSRLSAALHPHVQVSQLELLAGVTWSDLRTRLPRPNHTNAIKRATDILLDIIAIDESDFCPTIPLISYGLDSLSAAKLATALRPYLAVTQLQLLAHASWQDLISPKAASLGTHLHPNPTAGAQDTIVELCSGDGIPLIVFAGGDGSLTPLLALRGNFRGNLWAVQSTSATPTAPFLELASFFAGKIRDKRPSGPYRLASYSASSVMVVAVAKLLEGAGDEVVQLSFIDHFPALWVNASVESLLREGDIINMAARPFASMVSMLRCDPAYLGSPRVEQLELALSHSPEAAPEDIATMNLTRTLTIPLLQFLIDFYPADVPKSLNSLMHPFIDWFSSVKAPFSLLIAEFGTITTLPTALQPSWKDFGAHLCRKSVVQHVIPGVGHYGILGEIHTVNLLHELGRVHVAT